MYEGYEHRMGDQCLNTLAVLSLEEFDITQRTAAILVSKISFSQMCYLFPDSYVAADRSFCLADTMTLCRKIK